jgi:hypothetical protein
MVEVKDCVKHSSLLIITVVKGFKVEVPGFSANPERSGACTIKLYGFVIYEKRPNFAAS